MTDSDCRHLVDCLFVCLFVCLVLLLALHSLHAGLNWKESGLQLRVLKSKRFSVDHLLALVLTGEPVSLIRFLDGIV